MKNIFELLWLTYLVRSQLKKETREKEVIQLWTIIWSRVSGFAFVVVVVVVGEKEEEEEEEEEEVI